VDDSRRGAAEEAASAARNEKRPIQPAHIGKVERLVFLLLAILVRTAAHLRMGLQEGSGYSAEFFLVDSFAMFLSFGMAGAGAWTPPFGGRSDLGAHGRGGYMCLQRQLESEIIWTSCRGVHACAAEAQEGA
jgi:hypothetical protein